MIDSIIKFFKFAPNRQAETGVTLLSFSQAVRGLLRGKWQLLGPRVHRCHLIRSGQHPFPPAYYYRVYASLCP
jgi:hypothetical protein